MPEGSRTPGRIPDLEERLAERLGEEVSLDPGDWYEFRALAHRMVDDMVDFLSTVRERPVWRPMPLETRRRLRDDPLPTDGTDAAAVYAEFRESILPFPTGNIHPRFWGWVKGTGTPLGMLADMLASAMNNHVAGFDQSATIVEETVIGWLARLAGFPSSTSGILVDGASAANLIGLAVARQAAAGFDVRSAGLRAGPQLALYSSAETHSSVRKAVELLGLGDEAYRKIPVDEKFRIRIDALESAIERDRERGVRPFCLVGNAGTVNTGAIDDLPRLARLCREEGLWFHVDGAFGAFAAWSELLRPLVAGLEEADSLAFDLHKWGYQPYDIGVVLIRDAGAHRGAFSVQPHYLASVPRGIMAGGLPFAELGVQLSRGFRALKAWMALKVHGSRGIARVVEQNVAQARYLAARISEDPRLELASPVSLNVVCFRYAPQGVLPTVLDDWNREILMRIQERGLAVPSSTVLRDRFVLRVAIVNHRSRLEDFDALVAATAEIGDEVRRESPVEAATS